MKHGLVFASALVGGIALSWKFAAKKDPTDLNDKVVIITGATSAIGETVAHALAAEGASIVLVAREEPQLAKVVALLEQYQVPVLSIPADVTRDGEVEILANTIMEHFGRIDVLVNNAGIFLGGTLLEIETRQLRNMVAVNLYAPMRLVQRLLPIMLRQGSGHIVNVACAASLAAAPSETAYAATKAGLIAFSDGLRRELAGTGVQVSIIVPGSIEQPAIEPIENDDQAIQSLFSKPIMMAEPWDVAQSVLDAIRFNRREVITGELPFKLGALPGRVAVPVVDLYYKLFGKQPALSDGSIHDEA